ncbi:hypothetical protein L7F22_014005 [Adiantum nelumboides]|nr:hypothetical protein [Adiantum nelumboides]
MVDKYATDPDFCNVMSTIALDHMWFKMAIFSMALKAYKGDPPQEPILDDSPEFEGPKELLQPKHIIRHEDMVLHNGKVLCKYLIKFKNYHFDNAKLMQEPQVKDNMSMVATYNELHKMP